MDCEFSLALNLCSWLPTADLQVMSNGSKSLLFFSLSTIRHVMNMFKALLQGHIWSNFGPHVRHLSYSIEKFNCLHLQCIFDVVDLKLNPSMYAGWSMLHVVAFTSFEDLIRQAGKQARHVSLSFSDSLCPLFWGTRFLLCNRAT